MNYFIDLFSPETASAFSKSEQKVSGFRISRRTYIDNKKIGPSDKFICYLIKLQRFVGILEVKSTCFIDDSPIFYKKRDPFVLRFKVKPLVWLPIEKAVPIHEDFIWKTLSFTKNLNKNSTEWTHMVFSSPKLWPVEDCIYLEKILFRQAKELRNFPLSELDKRKLRTIGTRKRKKIKNKSSRTDDGISVSLSNDLVRILQKPAEIYEWPIYNKNINLSHAFQDNRNPYPYNNKLNPAPGSIILLRSIEDKAFVAIGFVLSSNHSSKQEQQKLKNIFKYNWTKSFYLHPFVFKGFRVRLKNVGMKPHRVPARISKENFLRVFQRVMLQIKEISNK